MALWKYPTRCSEPGTARESIRHFANSKGRHELLVEFAAVFRWQETARQACRIFRAPRDQVAPLPRASGALGRYPASNDKPAFCRAGLPKSSAYHFLPTYAANAMDGSLTKTWDSRQASECAPEVQ